MKFTFDKELMQKKISVAQEIINSKSAGTILSNVLLIAKDNMLTIKATDGSKLNFEGVMPITIEEEGSTTIYCDKFNSILSSMDYTGEIEFSQIKNEDNNNLISVIRPIGKKSTTKLKTMSEKEFPTFSSGENLPYFKISSKEFKDMIRQTQFAVSDDQTRFFMNGVYFEKKGEYLNLVATDGRRLSIASQPLLAGVNDFPSAIVHPKILNIIMKHAPEEGEIDVSVVEKMIFFQFADYKFSAVLIDGLFPNYETVIPRDQPNQFQVKKDDLVSSLRMLSQMIKTKKEGINFNLEPGNLKLSAFNIDYGSSEVEIPCRYAGNNLKINLSLQYIEEPLKEIKSEYVVFEFTDERKAVTLHSEPASFYSHIIMPIQSE